MTATAATRTVASVMSSDPICIARGASVAEAAELLDAYELGGLPVVDVSGELAGVVSQADLVRLRAADLPWNGWHGIKVEDVMSRPAWTIAPTEPLAEAAALMSERHDQPVDVIGAEGEPIGMVSQSDLVREIA